MLVSYQMNVIFYDAMIMLPIVIVYLEELLDGGAPYRYAFALGLTVLLQFYMGTSHFLDSKPLYRLIKRKAKAIPIAP